MNRGSTIIEKLVFVRFCKAAGSAPSLFIGRAGRVQQLNFDLYPLFLPLLIGGEPLTIYF